ncbi:MAG TPA: 4-alpha-glucanotransferase [Streptosporangiaceae bacterium]
MQRADLVRQAQARGVAGSYRDWRGREVEVGSDTLAAILDALGDADPPAPGPFGIMPEPGAGAAPPSAPRPPGRSWGFTVQLYALRSRGSWGHGDLRDLADLAAWSGRGLGAGFVLCSPLHAAEPKPPVTASPYLPMSRRFTSPLYLRIEDIPEYGRLGAAGKEQIAALAGPLRARNATADLIDRDAVWAAKRAACEILWSAPEHPARRAEFERFRARQGRALDDWATWCALAEVHGPDWRNWPARLRDPRSAAVTAERARLAGAASFHAWLQWLAGEQRAAAQRTARAAGMDTGIIHDLAVGAHPGGADAWAGQDVIVQGVSVGAPPDEFNQVGQDWTLPPWHPGRLAAQGYRPLAGLIDATLSQAGGIRADHVMGLLRLWWVPAGMTPDRGTYVRYDQGAMVGVLASRAARAGALAVGEDLGTVEPWIRRYLADRGVLGTSMLWFERCADGTPLPPDAWRRDCLATVGTHDVPPAAGFVTGEHVALRARLGLLGRTEDAERADAAAAVEAWRSALTGQGLLAAGSAVSPDQFTVGLYGYLARTPAALIGVSLAEAVGERRPQNLPGTSTEYPNWRIPLGGPDGRPVLAEDLAADPLVAATVRAVRNPPGGRARPGGPGPGSAARAVRNPAGPGRPGGPGPGSAAPARRHRGPR